MFLDQGKILLPGSCLIVLLSYLLYILNSRSSFQKATSFYFYFLNNFFYCCSSTIVSLSSHLLPPAPPIPSSHPPSYPPLALSICLLRMFLDPSLTFPFYPPPASPLRRAMGRGINLFFVSMSLVLFCSLICFVDKVPLIGEIIWYLSFSVWLISLSIMLSSSIHAVTKGMSLAGMLILKTVKNGVSL